MKIQPLKIGTMTAKVPVIQGGMGVGISLGNLAGAVAKEGGIGIISAAQPGFREEDFIKDPLKANLRAIKSEYEKARKIASDVIIGFNLMVAMEHYEEYVHAVVEAGADLIVSGAGLPTDLPKYVGESDILLAPIVSTAKSAKLILKYYYNSRKYIFFVKILTVDLCNNEVAEQWKDLCEKGHINMDSDGYLKL